MCRPLLLAAAALVLGCDPGSFKRFPIDDSAAISPIEQVLRDFEREHLGSGFNRAEISDDVARTYLNCECKVLRWYDRDRVVTFERGSYFWLAVFFDREKEQLSIATGAFPSFGEPGNLQDLRLDLSRRLSENGFLVNDTELR